MLRTVHYVLRPFEADDAQGFVDAVRESAATLSTWMPWAHAQYSIDEARAWIGACEQHWAQRTSFEFGIFDAATGTLVGGAGLNHLNTLHGFCNLGYWVRQSFHRRGAASETIDALAGHAFTQLGMGRVEIVVAVGNDASLATARKARAVEEGIARNRLRLGEGFIDAHMLALLPPAAL